MTNPVQVLLLPGMALNATIFPALGHPTRAPAFSRGPTAPGPGMTPYVADVDRLTATPDWRDASARVVVGHSFGGMLALAWLLAHGGAGEPPVAGLLLVATTAGPMYDVATVRLGPVRLRAGPLMGLWDHPAVSMAAKGLFALGGTAEVDFQRYRHRSELAVGIAGWRQTSLAGRRAYRRAMRGFDVRDRLDAIQVPAIVLHGDRDTYFRTPVAEDLARRLPRAQLRLVPGARHVLPLTHGGHVLRALRDLLAP